MHIDSMSLLANAALIAVGVLVVIFLMWFLVALTLEKNGTHIRCRVEYRVGHAVPTIPTRQPIKEKSVSGADFRPSQILVTHRAALALIPKYDFVDETRQTRPYLAH